MSLPAPTVSFDASVVQAIYGITVVTSVVLAWVVWRHREKTGAKPLLVAIFGGLIWSTTLFLNTFTANYAVSMSLNRVLYVGVVVATAGVFLFSLEYTGREHLLTRRTVALLSIEPAIVIPLAFFNPGDVFFENVYENTAAAVGFEIEFGVGFALHAVYSYGLTLAASALVVGLIYRTRAMYRGQLAVLIGAVLLPLIPNYLAIARVVNFDATPLGFLIANLLYTVAITRYRLIDLAPIARDRVVANVNDAVFVVDTEHRIVDVNPAGEEMSEFFGGDPHPIGNDFRSGLSDHPEVREGDERTIESGTEQTIEYRVGGHYFLTDATPIHDARDRTVGWLFVTRDVTDQRRREYQLRDRNEQLDEFASVVSHDLRNPLQVASGRVEIVQETGEVEHLDEAAKALDRMEAIIEDVLSLARSGEAVADLEPVSIEEVAADAWRNVDTDDAALEVATDARVTADRDRLTRLLENLFGNTADRPRRRRLAPRRTATATRRQPTLSP